MRQPTLKYDIKRIALAAILSFGMVAGPVPALAEGEDPYINSDEIEDVADVSALDSEDELLASLAVQGMAEEENEENATVSEATPTTPVAVDTIVSWYYKDGTLYLNKDSAKNRDDWTIDAESVPDWITKHAASITEVVIEKSNSGKLAPASMAGWFKGCAKLTSIVGLENLDTSHVTDMSELFSGCKAVKYLDLSNFSISKSVEAVDLDSEGNEITVSVGTDTTDMFKDCTALESLNLGKDFHFNGCEIPSGNWTYLHPAKDVKEPTSDREYTAKKLVEDWDPATMAGIWSIDKVHNITFDKNGGTGDAMEAQTGLYNEVIRLSANTYEKSGYVFGGWLDTTDGIKYSDGDVYVVTGNATLEAIWEEEGPISVTYKGNGAEGEDIVVKEGLKSGAEYKIADGGFSRDGYVLLSWNTAADGSGKTYAPNEKITLSNSGLTLYAQWLRVDFKGNVENEPEINLTSNGKAAVARGVYALLSAEQKAAITDENVLTIYLEARSIRDAAELEARADDINAIKKFAADVDKAESVAPLDIKLYYQVGAGDKIALNEPGYAVEFDLTVADNLVNQDATKVRKFFLIRANQGVAENVEIKTQTAKVITAQSDHFSTYGIAYRDSSTNSGSGSASGSTTTTTKASTTTRSTTPNTGDNSLSTVAIGAIAVVGVGAVGYGVMRRRRN